MAEVTEQWKTRTFKRYHSARRVFDISQVEDEVEALAALYDQKGVQPGSGHPLDSTIFVPGDGIDITRDGRMYIATVDYRPPPGFGFDPTPVEDLLAQKWRVSVDPTAQEEPADRTATQLPITNSAYTPIEGLTRPVQGVTIAMWRWENEYELSKHLAYANKWNSDSVVLPRLGTAAPGELLCQYIKMVDEVSADTDLSPAVKVLYVFTAKPRFVASSGTYHGFHRRVLDQGREGTNTDGVNPITYKTGGPEFLGKPVNHDVLLNGLGVPLDTDSYNVGGEAGVNESPWIALDVTADGVFLLYDMTEGSIAFSGLDIGANL